MKKVIGFLGIALVILLVASCKDDTNNDGGATNAKLADYIKEGSWRVTYFWDADVEATGEYAGYDFSFGANNVVTAFNGSNVASGTWATGTDDNETKLLINFGFEQGFTALSNDWRVEELTPTKVRMLNQISGGTQTDYLTIEKN